MPASNVHRLSSGSFECLGSSRCEGCHDDNEDATKHFWYRSGATFQGIVEDYKKTGHGIFTWPSGARYEGDYSDNKRNGTGHQLWPDGSEYEGEFIDDLRHGDGLHTWPNGEKYCGTFFHDRRHGTGTYSWPNGSTFTGTFYMDRREGYGKFTFSHGTSFEGLYKDDSRFGPGVTTYSDGRQDVGLWHGEKLIRICTPIAGAFSISDHPEFDYKPEEHETFLTKSDHSKEDMETIFEFSAETKDMTDKLLYFFNDTLHPQSYAVNHKVFDEEFYKENNNNKNNNAKNVDIEKVRVQNRTPFLIEIQRHILKHQFRQNTTSFNVERILNGDRKRFKEKGPLELASERLLMACISGDQSTVLQLLDNENVHANVGDKNGHTPLIGASVNWHLSLINTLLDYGADVNQLNDDGCSALSALCVYYYPVSSFHYNIAERYLQKPESSQSETDLHNYDDVMASASVSTEIILSNAANAPVAVKSTCESKASVDSGFPASGKRSQLSGEVISGKSPTINQTTASPLHSVETQNVHGFRQFYKLGQNGRDSALGSEQEYTPSVCDMLGPEDFESENSMRNYPIEVTDALLERCATNLSQNERVVSGRRSHDANSATEGKARFMAIQISERDLMKRTLDLLLRRGANPSVSDVPMPVLFFAIKAADVDVVRTLLEKGAITSATLTEQKGGLAPLHIAVAIPGDEGVQITQLLLNVLSDPNVRASRDDAFLNRTLEEEWSKDIIDESDQAVLGGRTPLHIVCARDDNYTHACKVVRLLLDHGAKADLLCNGFSPLALAIASGNDMVIDELLSSGADPSLRLTHGVGSALCVATSTEYEHRRSITHRLGLVDKLIKAGADILSPVLIGPKRLTGTAVDYAYYMFNQDRVIAHMPYHALTYAERDTFNCRRKLLVHMGDTLRRKALEGEKLRREKEAVTDGPQSPLPSSKSTHQGDSRVTFKAVSKTDQTNAGVREIRKPLVKYCYECGRSVGVRLTACTRCKEVYYCSKVCKLKAWTSRHKDECVRIGNRPNTSKTRGRSASPPKTPAEKAKSALTKDKCANKINVLVKGRSKSAKVVPQKVYVDRDGNRVSSADAEKKDIHMVYMDNYSFN